MKKKARHHTNAEASPDDTGNSTAMRIRFAGAVTPRQLRALRRLLDGPCKREELDCAAGCSNSPALVAELRQRGLTIPCDMARGNDRDGHEIRFGVYSLSQPDAEAVRTWFGQRPGEIAW